MLFIIIIWLIITNSQLFLYLLIAQNKFSFLKALNFRSTHTHYTQYALAHTRTQIIGTFQFEIVYNLVLFLDIFIINYAS